MLFAPRLARSVEVGRDKPHGQRRRLFHRDRLAGCRHGQMGQGQEVARARVHDQGHPALGLSGHDGPGQGLLGVVLEGLVDGNDEVVAADRGLVLLETARYLAPGRVHVFDQPPRPAFQQRVVLVLEAGQALPVCPHHADERGRQLPGRVETLRLLHRVDAHHVAAIYQFLDLGGGVVGDRPSQVDEPAGLAQLLLQGRDRGAEHGSESLRLVQRVSHLVGVGIDRGHGHRHGELVTVAVEDRPPLTQERDLMDILRARVCLVLRRVHALDEKQPRQYPP